MTMEYRGHSAKMSRRTVLQRGVAGAALISGMGMAAKVLAEEPTPGMTQGPYWVDEMLNRSDVTTDPSTGQVALGFPLRLTICVSQLDADGNPTPLPGAFVDIWHCNAVGVYSDVAAQNTVGMKFLRGYQVTNARGIARFTTIYPGWYSGRTVHIHYRVRVYDADTDTVTYNQVAQFFFNDQTTDQIHLTAPYNEHPGRDTYNNTDGIYEADSDDDGVADGQELLLTMSAKQNYALATYNIDLDLNDPDLSNGDQGDTGGGPPDGGGGGMPPDGPPPDGGTPPDGGFPPGGGPPPAS